jgi:tRNA1(Val) A37 N6-methylase TrmN6
VSDPSDAPAPAAADDALERVQLTQHLHLWQRRRGHRSATDDVLCAWAAARACPQARRVLDLGCGQGSVTLMLAQALPGAALVGVEAQAVSASLGQRNVADNALGDRVRILHGDLRDAALPVGGEGFDLATGSPPFMPLGSGTLPSDPQRAAGRFELRGGIEVYAAAAARWLGPAGVAVLLMDGAQDARCRGALAHAGLALRRVVAVAPRTGAEPRYRIYVAGRDTPAEVVEESLTVRAADGAWTPAFAGVRVALGLPGA